MVSIFCATVSQKAQQRDALSGKPIQLLAGYRANRIVWSRNFDYTTELTIVELLNK
jgi:hypothetical protein